MTDEYDDYDDDEDEVADLWNGRLPMDRVLQTLQSEIEERQQTQAQLAAAVASAEAAEAEHTLALVAVELLKDKVAALRAQLSAREWRPVTVTPPEGVLLDLLVEQGVYLGREFCAPTGRAGDGPFPVKAAAWRLWRPAPPDSEEDGAA